MTKGTIFNIQKFSITDGVGIRTLVFMKGCPLRCLWCSNPESQLTSKEIMDVKTNCTGCGKCVGVCPEKAIDPVTFDIDRERCTVCGKCTESCFANAKKTVGDEMTLADIMMIIEKDRVFYRNSGGGVTIGGGEPTMQAEFVTELLRNCKLRNIHTAIETCGYGSWGRIGSVFQYTDQIFYDIKSMDSDTHKELTGAGNEQILENAARIAELGKDMIIRMPVIPGMNDDQKNIADTGEFVQKLYEVNDRVRFELLPYHDFGRDKYKWLSRDDVPESIPKPDEREIENHRRSLSVAGIPVIF